MEFFARKIGLERDRREKLIIQKQNYYRIAKERARMEEEEMKKMIEERLMREKNVRSNF